MKLAAIVRRRAGGWRALLAAAVSCVTLTISSVSHAATIGISPSSTTVTVGMPFGIGLHIDDVVDLYAYQVTIAFDPTLLQASSPLEGSFLLAGGGTVFFPGIIDNALGQVAFLSGSLTGVGPGVTGNGLLAQLRFIAVSAGTSTVDVLFDVLNGDVLLDSQLSSITAGVSSASVTATAAVPEPASAVMVVSALLGFLARRRTPRRAAA